MARGQKTGGRQAGTPNKATAAKAASDRLLPISQHQIADAIKADEQFLAAHPLQVRRKRAGGDDERP